MAVPGRKADKDFCIGSQNSFEINCDPCHEVEGIFSKPEGFCTTCNEFMCSSCLKAHLLMRKTRNHEVLRGDDMPGTRPPEPMEECTDICEKHSGQIIRYYCKCHRCVGCMDCIALEHTSCGPYIALITDISSNESAEQEFQGFSEKLDQLNTLFTNSVMKTENHVQFAETQFKKATNDASKFIEEVIRTLHSLQNVVERCALDIKSKDCDKMQKLSNQSKSLLQETKQIVTEFEHLKKCGRRSQQFTLMKKKNLRLENLEELGIKIDDENFVSDYQFIPDKKIKDIQTCTTQLGSLITGSKLGLVIHEESSFSQPKLIEEQGVGGYSTQPSADSSKAQAPAAPGIQILLQHDPNCIQTSPDKRTSVTSPKSQEVSIDGYYVNREDEDQHIHFEPVIELPDKVEVKTGEEEEEVIFCHRAKLFRFNKGEWKERGLGDIKILFNEANLKARLLMRREQILKLCCNHYITSDINFQPMPNSKGCALVWYAMDFSEDVPSTEKFSIKFKTAEIVSKFQDAIQTALKKTSSKPAVETIRAASKTEDKKVEGSASEEADDDVIFVKEEIASAEDIAKARKLQLPDNFYLYETRHPCPGCRGCDDRMPEDDVLNPKTDNQDEDKEEEDVEDFEDEDEEDEEEEEDDEENADGKDDAKADKPQQTGVFGAKSSLFGWVQASGSSTPSSGGFLFGSVGSSSGFSFSDIAASSGVQSFQSSSSKPFQWQGAGKQLFGAGGGADNESGEEQGDDPHFKIPDLIEVKTGEEDETVEFSQRAKLFRFDKDNNQWKEKGIGEMKILKHKETNKYRLLLRRQQVHKLACNHLLTPDLRLTPLNTSETSWCWSAQDFSDSEPKLEQLAVKFKTIDQAKYFKAKFEEVQAEQNKLSSEAPLMSSLLTGDLDD